MKIVKKKLVIASHRYLDVVVLLHSTGGEARLVGGVVRDALLGIAATDIDIITNLTPDRIISLFTHHHIPVLPTGIKHGTVTVIWDGEKFEITTLRKDILCDGRHALVEYSNDFALDAQRRDFTINALSYCPIKQEIYDYFDGIADLNNGKVVFIGNPDQRIQEDYLRILRFFRFSCRFRAQLDTDGLNACVNHREKLTLLSRERIKHELDLILALNQCAAYVYSMFEHRILEIILPVTSYDHELFHKIISIAQHYNAWPCNQLLYAILIKDTNQISSQLLLDLKFTKKEIKHILLLIQYSKTPHILHTLSTRLLTNMLRKIWLDETNYLQYFILFSALNTEWTFIDSLYQALSCTPKPLIPITGHDVQPLGCTGKRLGQIMTYLKNQWIDSDFTFTYDNMIDLARNYGSHNEK